MRRLSILVLLVLAACGSEDGEPAAACCEASSALDRCEGFDEICADDDDDGFCDDSGAACAGIGASRGAQQGRHGGRDDDCEDDRKRRRKHGRD